MQVAEVFLVVGALATVFKSGDCIRCLQCTTLLSKECENGDVQPRECDEGVKYCIKYIGEVKRFGVVVFRDCYKDNIENVCTDKEIEGHNIRACYVTCDTDGCNGGPVNGAISQYITRTSTHIIFLLGIGLMLAYMRQV